jgi:hypothetical protein
VAEQTAYFDSITAARSMLLTDEEALAGGTTISMETQEEFTEDDFYVYCRERFPEWLKMLRSLPLEQQELILSYYLVGKTQSVLAKLWSSTQTVMSFRIRMAVKLAGTYLMMGGAPSVDQMRSVLIKAGLEHSLKKVSLSGIIVEYARCHSFERIANANHLHRPDIRRAMSQASKQLLRGDVTNLETTPASPEELALGAYIFNLIDKADPSNVGTTKRQKEKTARFVVRVDPPCVGEFRVAVSDPGWDSLFVSRANR